MAFFLPSDSENSFFLIGYPTVGKKSARVGQIGQKITKNTKAIPRLAKKVLGARKLIKK